MATTSKPATGAQAERCIHEAPDPQRRIGRCHRLGSRARVPRSPRRSGNTSRSTTCKMPATRRNINADAKLLPIFGKDQVTMFELTKLVNAHLK